MIEIYSKDNCVYCLRAIALLNQLGLAYNEQKLGVHFTREHLIEQYPTAMSFPVVVIGGMYIGGFDQLKEHCNTASAEKGMFLKG